MREREDEGEGEREGVSGSFLSILFLCFRFLFHFLSHLLSVRWLCSRLSCEEKRSLSILRAWERDGEFKSIEGTWYITNTPQVNSLAHTHTLTYILTHTLLHTHTHTHENAHTHTHEHAHVHTHKLYSDFFAHTLTDTYPIFSYFTFFPPHSECLSPPPLASLTRD